MTTRPRVLVADDEEFFLKRLKALFEQLDCVVDTGSNYCDVRTLIESNAYALIVCDKGMPISDESRPYDRCGLELLATAKSDGPNRGTPFVLYTADDRNETREIVEKLGGIYECKRVDQMPLALFRTHLDRARRA